MTQHLTAEEIASFRARSLPPQDLFRVWRHASSCEPCGERIRRPELLHIEIALAQAELEGKGVHLTYDDIAEYVDGRLSIEERRRVEDHIAVCGMCAGDVRAITELRDDLNRPLECPDQTPAPSASPLEKRRPLPWLWTAGAGVGLALAAMLILMIFIFPHRRSEAPVPTVANSAAPDRGRPAPSGSAVHDGSRLLSVANGSVTGLDGLPDAYRGTVAAALSSGSLEEAQSPLTPKLRMGQGVLMGGETENSGVRLVDPVNEVVEEQIPLLTWTHAKGAVYQVSVGDREFKEVARSGWIHESSWRVPTALERGRIYEWQVLVRRGNKEIAVPSPPNPPARFQVLPAQGYADIEGLRKTFGDSHLVMGTAFARYGIWGNAADQFRVLQQQNPKSLVVTELVRNLDRMRSGKQ